MGSISPYSAFISPNVSKPSFGNKLMATRYANTENIGSQSAKQLLTLAEELKETRTEALVLVMESPSFSLIENTLNQLARKADLKTFEIFPNSLNKGLDAGLAQITQTFKHRNEKAKQRLGHTILINNFDFSSANKALKAILLNEIKNADPNLTIVLGSIYSESPSSEAEITQLLNESNAQTAEPISPRVVHLLD